MFYLEIFEIKNTKRRILVMLLAFPTALEYVNTL